ncbi:hypothetical protein GGR50DRAFT_442706 [Xylaria sp. CBS 124048]|nr:hypothetical protein GGR50DRAFT_442706 [Xylaria sp. CBS 124048]
MTAYLHALTLDVVDGYTPSMAVLGLAWLGMLLFPAPAPAPAPVPVPTQTPDYHSPSTMARAHPKTWKHSRESLSPPSCHVYMSTSSTCGLCCIPASRHHISHTQPLVLSLIHLYIFLYPVSIQSPHRHCYILRLTTALTAILCE